MDRFAYADIEDRPRLRWPNGARVALLVVPNVEHYEYTPPANPVRDPWPRTPHPDIVGYATRDYGNRVGMWRMLDAMDRHGVRGTASISIGVFDHYPEVIAALEARRWDYMCHGVYNTRYLWGLPEDEERAIIRDCVQSYKRHTGRDLPGWCSPALSNTVNTPDLVAEAGIKYYGDAGMMDDQPFPLNVRSGRLLSLPYSVNLNDAVNQRQGHESEEFARMCMDAFDTLYAEGGDQARVLALSVHPYILGMPQRVGHFEQVLSYICGHADVWKATGEEIADWYYATAWDEVVGHLQSKEARRAR